MSWPSNDRHTGKHSAWPEGEDPAKFRIADDTVVSPQTPNRPLPYSPRYNRTMLDFSPKQFQSSLADTVVWCKMKSVGMDADSDDVRQRHALYTEAEQQWEEAQETIRRGRSGPKIEETKQWQKAMALLKQIRDSLGPMDRNLRSPELKPSFSLDEFEDDALWAQAVAEVVASRSRLRAGTPAEKRDMTVAGRLLLYNPSENLACGAAEVSSNGFFDVNNVPPWDIWIDFSEGTLVSWVPPALLDVAQMGIYVNPEECIRWAKGARRYQSIYA